MKEKGVTFRQTSQETGVAKSTLQRIAKNETIQTDVIDKLLIYFHCRLTDLIVHIPEHPVEYLDSRLKKDVDLMIREAKDEHIRPQNQKALNLLYEWLSEPDNPGEEWWDEFEQELAENRPVFREFNV